MASNSKKKSIIKEESDSGVDNTSESGHSGDEDHLAIPSDDELLSSENESSSIKNRTSNPIDENSFSELIENFAVDSSKNFSEKIPEQYVKIELNNNNNNEKFIKGEYEEVLNFYADLASSQCETVDFSIMAGAKPPEWFVEEKFKRGQKFARDHLFCINFAEMVSLFILFAQKSSLGPLIFTGKSDSPFTAFRRYLNTLTKLMSWYEDDIWNESNSLGAKNLSTVRGMHKNVYLKLTNSPAEDLARKTTLGDPSTTAMWCPLRDLIVEDFTEVLPPPSTQLEQLELLFPSKKVWLNQADMSMTQFGFVGLAVTYPEYFGIHSASEEDLDAFLHLWRCLGYLLGIKDKYNYCNTTVESVRLRTKFFLEVVAKPAFRDVTFDWEHMCRCVTAGISYYLPLVNFESSLLYLCHILKINTPRLKKQRVLQWLNFRLYEAIKKVQNAPPEVLTQWQNREFSYTNQPGKCPIRSYCPNPEV